jgi:predicted acetyltransferase
MNQPATLRRFDPAAHMDRACRLISLAFAGPLDGCKQWLELGGHENVRVFGPPADAPDACLLQIPMGQYFGGVSVPLLGIAGVAVAPERRGRGLARGMMTAALQQAAESGTSLAGLYASTQSLYRSLGFEQAGSRFRIRVPMAWLDVRERDRTIVPLEDTTDPRVRDCYAAYACGINGMLDRGQYIWSRIKKNRGVESSGFGVLGPSGTIDAYAFLVQTRLDSGRQDITLNDLAFRTHAAARQLLGFLADFAPIADHLEFFGGHDHPALLMLGQQRHQVALKDNWFLRILNLKTALETRRFNPVIRGELHLRVTDPILPENAGDWRLVIECGRAALERGGRGDLCTGPRGLAALYSGFQSAEALTLSGLCQGPREALAAATAVFAGPAPSMSDFY